MKHRKQLHRKEEDMIDIEKAQQHYSNLAAFAADVTMWADAAEEDKALETVRQLANRLANKWRGVIAEACFRERMSDGDGAKVAMPTPKAKAGVRVLKEGEEA